MNKTEENNILKVEGLTKMFKRPGSRLLKTIPMFTAVDNVSFEMKKGELMGLLGESGCGKSTLARMLMHLIVPDKGRIILDGEEVQDKKESAFRKKRNLIQMVFQNPFDCLDPVRHVKSLLEEPLKLWKPELNASERLERIHEVIGECGLPENSLGKLPREFSGGQLQRLSIARALLIEPKVLIADEIISALDVSVQAQILNLLRDLQQKMRLTYVFIGHGLGAVHYMSHRIAVMYMGRVVEMGPSDTLFDRPAHPYTRALLDAAPVADDTLRDRPRVQLTGEIGAAAPEGGCPLLPRCPYADGGCHQAGLTLRETDGRQTACARMLELDGKMACGNTF